MLEQANQIHRKDKFFKEIKNSTSDEIFYLFNFNGP